MKKIHFVFVLAFMFISMGSMNVKAQPPSPCDPDSCLEASFSWVYDTTRYIPQPNCPDCWMDIAFKYRGGDEFRVPECPNSPQVEFIVESILVSGGCFSPCDFYNPPTSIYKPEDLDNNSLWAQAHTYLLKNKLIPGAYPFIDPGTLVLESVKTARCFSYELLQDSTRHGTWCDDLLTCCVQKLTVTTNVYGEVTNAIWDITDPPQQGQPCDTLKECIEDCTSYGSDLLVPKVAVRDDELNANHSSKLFKIEPNPANESIYISYIGKEKPNWGKITINLLNINGESVIIQEMDSMESKAHIDIKRIASGYYIIVFKSNNGIVYSEGFIKSE